MLLILSLSLLTSVFAQEPSSNIPKLLRKAEIKYRLPRNLLSALAKVESGHNHLAFVKEDGKSKKSSYGLLQIQYASAKDVGFKGHPKQLMKPEINIEYGAAYLRKMLDMHDNDMALALTCFNSGPFGVNCRQKKYGKYAGTILNAWIDYNK